MQELKIMKMMRRRRARARVRRDPEAQRLAARIRQLSPDLAAELQNRLEDNLLLQDPLLRESLEQMHHGDTGKEFVPRAGEIRQAAVLLAGKDQDARFKKQNRRQQQRQKQKQH